MMIATAERLKLAGEYYFSRKLSQIGRMRASGTDVINLGIGSPDLSPASDVIEATAKALRISTNHGYASYRSSPELRSAIAKWYGVTYGIKLDPETQVLPLLGSKEGILYVTMAFVNPGDVVLVPNPGYPAYSSLANLLGARVCHYDLTEENNWEPDFAALEKMDLAKAKVMWVNYPHMPSGAAGSNSLFEKLVEFGRRKKILICHDNPYGLVLNEEPPRSLLRYDPKMEISLELNSLSKSFSMAGWRVGMALGSEAAINALLQVKSNVDSGMFIPVQAGAVRALALEESWHQERNETYRTRREYARKIFDTLGFKYSLDQMGLFVWAKAPAEIASVEKFLDGILEKAHVFLTPGFIFGSRGERYARISLCAPAEIFAQALERIRSKA